MHVPLVCLVSDRNRCAGRPLEEVVSAAVAGGVGMVQLRERDLPSGELFILAERLRDVTSRGKALLFVNDRVDIAMAVGADGVQLPENGLSLSSVMRVSGLELLLGRSVHSVEGAIEAERHGADLLVAGTVYPTASHETGKTQGTALLRKIRDSVHIPYLAIGGVTVDNIGDTIAAGASGAAVISAISEAGDPERAAREMVEKTRFVWELASEGGVQT